MALPYFYEPSVTAITSNFTLSEETHHHCVQVLRMKEGEQLQLTNGKGLLVTAALAAISKKQSVVSILDEKKIASPLKQVSLAVSLLKNASRFEWLLEKATELGVTEITPLLCDRTERQHFRFDRMNGIIIAAMLQSQQSFLPTLHQPVSAEKCIMQTTYQQKLIAHCEEDTRTPLRSISISNRCQILIGPEGDFSPKEIELALANQFQPVMLGNTRLRTETAAVAAATLLCMQ
jgi:16S rRNA (uracil1498-N3)-methyltransferase